MASKVAIKNSSRESVIKVFGSPGTQTIALDSDLLSHGQVINTNKSRTANVRAIYWACDNDTKIRITRNSEVVAVCAGNTGELEFMEGMADNHNNSHDIVVDIIGGEGVVWISLNKDGYLNTVELSNFSVYDNPNMAGE